MAISSTPNGKTGPVLSSGATITTTRATLHHLMTPTVSLRVHITTTIETSGLITGIGAGRVAGASAGDSTTTLGSGLPMFRRKQERMTPPKFHLPHPLLLPLCRLLWPTLPTPQPNWKKELIPQSPSTGQLTQPSPTVSSQICQQCSKQAHP